MIRLTTLAGCAIHRDGDCLGDLATHKQKFALLAYLAINGPVARDRLLALFWPEREEERARHSLSQALYAIKRELQEDCVIVTGDRVGLTDGAVIVDAREMQKLADDRRWEEVIQLYRGQFLDQFYLPRAPGFEDWQSQTRSRLGRLASQAFTRVALDRALAGDLQAAISTASRWVTLEPLEDEAQHALIALLGQSGDRCAALEQFESYRNRLAAELEVDPLEETASLVERIRAGEAVDYKPLAQETTIAVEEPAAVREPTPTTYGPPPEVTKIAEESLAEERSTGSTLRARLSDLLARRVFHVSVAYLAVAWLTLQITGRAIQRESIPTWTLTLLVILLVAALPVVLIPTWTQDRRGHKPTRAGSGGIGRRRWIESISGDHILAGLGTLLIVLLIVSALLETREAPPENGIDAARLNPNRIAVLYFDYTSDSPDDPREQDRMRSMATGFTGTLISHLSQAKALEVIPRNGVKPFRDKEVLVDSIARALEVGTLIEGTIIKSGTLIQLHIGLVDASSGLLLADSIFESTESDLISLLDDVIDGVSSFIRTELGVQIRRRTRQAGTESAAAWEAVFRAENLREQARALLLAKDTTAALLSLARADSACDRAISLDPDWLEPLLVKGWIASDRHTGESDRLALTHSERALDLEPREPRALELRGTIRYRLAQQAEDSLTAATFLSGAEQDLQVAVQEDPSLATAWGTLSDLLARARWRLAEANHAAEEAHEANSFLENNAEVLYRLCWTSLQLERYDAAARWCGEFRKQSIRDIYFMDLELTIMASEGGPSPDIDRAWELVDAVTEDTRGTEDKRRINNAVEQMRAAAVIARAGLADSARAVLDRIHQGADEELLQYVSYDEAYVRLMIGERDRSLQLLEEFLESEPGLRSRVARDHWFDSLAGDPRFEAIVDRNREPLFCEILCRQTRQTSASE